MNLTTFDSRNSSDTYFTDGIAGLTHQNAVEENHHFLVKKVRVLLLFVRETDLVFAFRLSFCFSLILIPFLVFIGLYSLLVPVRNLPHIFGILYSD